jgi:8-oxo-dGTP pyrophosphatase MutT (NUDIX family)
MLQITSGSLMEILSQEPAPPAPEAGLHPAGVLAPLFFNEGRPHLVFTQRTFTVRDHRGQISFPGGVRDPRDPDLLATALREAQEEIGLDPQAAEVLGALTPVSTITGYWITAFVAQIPYPYEFRLNSQEVRRLLLLPLEGFMEAGHWSRGNYTLGARTVLVCCWRQGRTVIWGATARLVLDLLQRLGENPFPGAEHVPCVD